MILGTIQMGDQKKPIIAYDDIWYDLHEIDPDTQGRDLLSLISDIHSPRIFHQDYFNSSISPERRQAAEIQPPQRFALPYTPRQIICIGRNYAAHAKELGNEIPETPMLFNKLPSSCIGDQDTIEIHPEYGRVDYEGEVAVVIGKYAENIPKDDVYDTILGYTLLNDITARDIQQKAKDKGHPWLIAKSLKTFCPIGPYITTKEHVSWPLEVDLELTVNSQNRQKGNTKQFIFDISTLISHISEQIPLYPGDIIATGTPEGVSPIHDGDDIQLTVSGLGTLRNKVKLLKNQ